ncbi:MAG TPA: alanine racemase C-terminal domain-containing protein [Microbacterium sp.]|nr:alanine racemase C-terminal domain-containing protein [Microbacterium sp.]
MSFGSSSAPIARISRSALARNVRIAHAKDPSAAIDLRRDACGHGADLVAAAAREAGVAVVIRDGDPVVPALALEDVFGLDGRGEPVMTLVAPVLQTKALLKGEGVSYGYRYRPHRDTRVALVSGGYAQGIARAIGRTGDGPAAAVVIRDEECPVIGRVAMDVCVVETGALVIEPRDEAVFFGAGRPDLLREWSLASGWTQLELAAIAGLHARREEIA